MTMSPPSVSEAKRRLREIVRKSEKFGITRDEMMKLPTISKLRSLIGRRSMALTWVWQGSGWVILIAAAAFASLAAVFVCYAGNPVSDTLRQQQYQALCTIDMPQQLVRVFRPPEDCSMCRGLRRIDRVSNLSPIGFQETYSDYGRPVVVTDATRNWTAQHVFSFRFLKSLYQDQLLEHNTQGCQLHSTDSAFSSLGDIFNDSHTQKRNARPWHIGWRNCGERAAAILRQHYSRPYFLPPNSQESQLAWIYLGSPGYRETMNIDVVDQPSWQAQLRGSQRWFLHPPPECYYQCESLEVTLNPGEIIVVDTTRWYHETAVVSDELSIAVGDHFENT